MCAHIPLEGHRKLSSGRAATAEMAAVQSAAAAAIARGQLRVLMAFADAIVPSQRPGEGVPERQKKPYEMSGAFCPEVASEVSPWLEALGLVGVGWCLRYVVPRWGECSTPFKRRALLPPICSSGHRPSRRARHTTTTIPLPRPSPCSSTGSWASTRLGC